MTAEQAAAELPRACRVRALPRPPPLARRARGSVGRRVFRSGPAPLAPPRTAERPLPSPRIRGSSGRRARPPAARRRRRSTSRPCRRGSCPCSEFLDRFRALLRERGTFTFDEAVAGLDRLSHAAAFWRCSSCTSSGEVQAEQSEVFGADPDRPAGGPDADRGDDVGSEAVA